MVGGFAQGGSNSAVVAGTTLQTSRTQLARPPDQPRSSEQTFGFCSRSELFRLAVPKGHLKMAITLRLGHFNFAQRRHSVPVSRCACIPSTCHPHGRQRDECNLCQNRQAQNVSGRTRAIVDMASNCNISQLSCTTSCQSKKVYSNLQLAASSTTPDLDGHKGESA
jgi:hypothetical protein